jgi:hypothetical protein
MNGVSRAQFSVATMTLLVIACASSAKSKFGSSDDRAANGNGIDGGFGGVIGDFGSDVGNRDAAARLNADAACASVREQGVSTPTNLYIMFDKSSSQTGAKWDSAKAGLDAFLNDPTSAGVRAAINFFPRPNDSVPACDQPAYKTPRVPFGVLPGNAAAIRAALQNETPNGFDTPMYPALGGAILGAIAEVQNRPGETGVVVLITDGEPAGPAILCGGVNPEDIGQIAGLAQSGFRYVPSIKTFVIGLPGVNSSMVNKIAAAGGTSKAYIVGTTNLQVDFQKALADVRGEALPCEFELPAKLSNKSFAYDQVNVEVTPGGTMTPIALTQSQSQTQTATCSSTGWRYDNPTDPRRIELCAETCAEVKADYGAKIEILLGCRTIVK